MNWAVHHVMLFDAGNFYGSILQSMHITINTRVSVHKTTERLGTAAAMEAAAVINCAIAKHGNARIIVATGNSQLDLISALTRRTDIDWSAVEVFHMDEYIGISDRHPSSFRYWIRNRVEEVTHPAQVHYLAGDAPDLDAEMARYAGLLRDGRIDLAFVGFGENGHIAFNDPPSADFADTVLVKRVTLDEACRKQQVGEGHFRDMDSTPREALTVTCPGLFRADAWICSVPDARKAGAVRDALEGPVSTACPASIVQTHPNASVYLDLESATLLSSVPETGMAGSDSVD